MNVLRVGRAADNDIVLADPDLAPRHAELASEDGAVVRLRDVSGTAGLAVWRDGAWRTVSEAEVGPDDPFRLAKRTCTINELVELWRSQQDGVRTATAHATATRVDPEAGRALGVVSIIFAAVGLFPVVGVIPALLALALGWMGLNRARMGNNPPGQTLNMIGIILSAIVLGVTALLMLLGVITIRTSGF